MSNKEIEFNSLTISRFTGIFSDPNNAGCSIVAFFAYALVFEEMKPAKLTFLCVCVVVCVLVTFSVSATILFVFVMCAYVMSSGNTRAQRKNRNILFLILLVTVILIYILYNDTIDSIFSDFRFLNVLQRRIEGNTQDGNLGGRMDIWKELFNNFSFIDYIILGKGIVMDSLGARMLPHNGFLFLFYSYGLPTVLLYLKKFFAPLRTKIVYSLPYVVLFCTVFINTGFSDYRFITFSTLIIFLTRYRVQVLKESRIEEKKLGVEV